ncbi:MAG: metallophosphoesterase [Planctomycetales bacterium]|nr:metallophosphoesterase [Planctomycetales bacterium]
MLHSQHQRPQHPQGHQRSVSSLSRRQLLQGSALVMCGMARSAWGDEPVAAETAAAAHDTLPQLRIGLMTDLHHADKQPMGTRHYRETIPKLTEAVQKLNESQVDLTVELGDLIDSTDSLEDELLALDAIQAEFTKVQNDRHYVLGNHCVHLLEKSEFLDRTSRREPHYAFDHGDHHFVILDACYRHDMEPYGRKNFEWNDSNIPTAEIDWLRQDLKSAAKPTVIFVHQRLDLDPPNHYAIKQSAAIREVLEQSRQVVAVLQGHSHKNEHQELNGIHYCTLRAMVEGSGESSNGYAILDLFADGSLKLHGFRDQSTHDWK